MTTLNIQEMPMASHALANDYTAKIKSLKNKHLALENRIEEALKSPSTASADFYLRQLKKQKLVLKDEIERMSQSA